MILITGGAYQGKTEYALNYLGYDKVDLIDGGTCNLDEIYDKPVITGFHLYIKRLIKEGIDTLELMNTIRMKNPDITIIVNELGCGVVPMDAFDRNYRETVGRICTVAAREAKEVHRVFCGIGTVIKVK
ncbi:MAG: bifunctional adenosylcobinamide kinase/adenosylcobinamide-phosphate guanylyltransferase [Anaerocolumna sp.]